MTRDELVERMEETIAIAAHCTDCAMDEVNHREITEAALAVVEAAGWGPPPEPVTEEEIRHLVGNVLLTGNIQYHVSDRQAYLRAVLASPVLASRGIRVEGQG